MFAALSLWLVLHLIGLLQGRTVVGESQEWLTPQPDPTIFEYSPTEKQEMFSADVWINHF
ncbi:uncharacterized protein LOC117890295 [Drosophila subobscura]|uniref:uncharacterized protein LOC117890295 n=1 Tax=Drosophila subobscura TaxID=7241 RepID=UPI00155A1151|nr:uncharacterized protein LOC117890295 [Drosophila subobscura]